jgi:hypothetical protein
MSPLYSVWPAGEHRGWRRDSLYRGDGDEFLVYGEKREAYTESAVEYFIPYMTAEVALRKNKLGPDTNVGIYYLYT